MNFFELAQEYWAFIALPIVVAGVVQALKNGFKKFFRSHHVGMRMLPFIPIVLGICGGMLLPLGTMQEKILIGGALGQMSTFIYKLLTRILRKKAALMAVAEKRGEE